MTDTPQTNPTVGVITRTKNRPILLKRALRSVLEQSYQDWRMVVINDGGDPEPVERMLRLFSEQARDRIQVIHNPTSLGMEAASNRGIQAIRDQVGYVVIHDDDDSWAPEFLTIAVAELEHARAAHPRIAGVITMANAIYERIKSPDVLVDRVEEYKPWLNHGLISLNNTLIDNQFAPIQFLYAASTLQQVGLYREDLPVLGDWEFNIRFLRHHDIMIIPQVLAFYHHRVEDGGTVYGNSIIAGRERHDFFRQLLKNEWLRNDLESGVTSLGALANAMPRLDQRLDEVLWRLGNHDGQVISGRGQGSVFMLWLRSGRVYYYFRRALRSLRTHGFRQTVRTIRQWAQTRRTHA